MQVQLQVLLAAQERVVTRSNTGSNTEVAKPQVLNGSSRKVLGFITVYKLYIRMKMRGEAVKE